MPLPTLSILPSLIILGAVACVAAALALRRHPNVDFNEHATTRIFASAIGIQAIHFIEEAATGFHERFPAVFGANAMPLSWFAAFNLLWLAYWAISVTGLKHSRRNAFFAAWFLALAGMLNAIAHPVLALLANGYFPGLVTSPIIGAFSYWLWRSLHRSTSRS